MIPVEHELLSIAISQAWQVAVLAFVVALAVRQFARNRPHLAHVLWLLVLVKCLTPPLWSSPTGIFSWAERALPPSRLRVEPARLSTELPTADVVVHLRQNNPTAEYDDNDSSAARSEIVVPSPQNAIPSSNLQATLVTFLMRLIATFMYVGWLTQLWICGIFVIATLSTVRWIRYWWRLRRSSVVPPPELIAVFESLMKKLRLRHRVRLLATSSRIGPAVMGVFRPTVVLPTVVVEGRSIEELEPLLAHELLHVRRGDIWIGFLQVVAQGIWWWHPLVWITGRMITREAERCCDEEVLAELGCTPAQYARGLLAVLELKRSLVAVSAFPGVRAVDVTSSRLERIMKLGQGCRRRTPWWCWGVMLLAAAVVLPGAALMGADDPPVPAAIGPATASATIPAAPTREVQPEPQPSAARVAVPTSETATGPLTDWTYDAKALVADVKSNFGLDDAKAREMLMEYLYNRLVYSRRGSAWHEKNQDDLSIDFWQGRIIYRGDAEPDGQRKHMVVRLSDTGEISVRLTPHKLVDPQPVRNEFSRIYGLLRQLADRGLHTVKLEVRVASGPPVNFDAAIRDWEFMPVRYPKTDGESLPNPRLTRRALPPHDPLVEQPKEYSETISQGWFFDDDLEPRQRASMSVEEGIAARMKVLDEEQSARLLEGLQQDQGAEVLAAPAITLFFGQTGSLLDIRESPFIVGLSPGRTAGDAVRRQIRVVTEGLRIHTRVVRYTRPEGPVQEVQLDLRVLLSHVQEVKTREVANLGTLQIPVVSRTMIESEFQLPLGKTLAIGGLQHVDQEGKTESLILLLEVKVPAPEDLSSVRSTMIERRTRATQEPRIVRLQRESQRIELAMDSEVIVEHEGRIADSELENPEILSVVPLSASRVQLVPRKMGSTHVAFFDGDQKLHQLNLRVCDSDLAELRTLFDRLEREGK